MRCIFFTGCILGTKTGPKRRYWADVMPLCRQRNWRRPETFSFIDWKKIPLNYHQTLHAPLMQHNIGINWSITKIENTTDCHRLKSKDISKENSIQNVILMYSVWSEGRAIFKNAWFSKAIVHTYTKYFLNLSESV